MYDDDVVGYCYYYDMDERMWMMGRLISGDV